MFSEINHTVKWK